MIFKWIVQANDKKIVRGFLNSKSFSTSQLSKIKNHDGHIYVNKKERYLNYQMTVGDVIIVQLPKESGNDILEAVDGHLDIKYEDKHYLIVDKPAGVASLPARSKSTPTMANFVKAYLQKNGESDAIHVVTRLDRDTSGLMIFAKKSLSHSRLGENIHSNSFKKQYIAIVQNPINTTGLQEINLPIGVSDDFYMRREVRDDGKDSLTRYEVVENYPTGSQVKVDLITGRTHQIRVHFSAIGHPLFGDSLYAKEPTTLINRQALHCFKLSFIHPFTQEIVEVESQVPIDIRELIHELKE
ncbi:pseudouridine synthase [Companilactobacillus sp. RD055328]|uniref:RluA family pseudouridine synthase n=1 Tax=Companilactobacillus sp. RD055328 TaxID=2916634 RepID=UPI001FC81F82|nr:RluA family pseudouridine synthase [Companilactobacillus sp. RD055328]GKQ43082.1 pseudouridine synthase [Companilactobacillus sp. RD055328]